MRARISRNLSGPGVRRFRCKLNWSQETLAEKLQDMGLNIGRQRIAKIENGQARVNDVEQFFLARIFGVTTADLVPKIDGSQSLYISVSRLTGGFKILVAPDELLAQRSEKLLNGHKNGHKILSRIRDKSSPPKPHLPSGKKKQPMAWSDYEI